MLFKGILKIATPQIASIIVIHSQLVENALDLVTWRKNSTALGRRETEYDLDLTLVTKVSSLLPVIHNMIFFNGIKMNATDIEIAVAN